MQLRRTTRATQCTDERNEQSTKGNYGSTSGSQDTISGLKKTFVGDLHASALVFVHLGDDRQVFVINAACCQQISKTIAAMQQATYLCGLLEMSCQFRPDAYTHDSQEVVLFSYSGDKLAKDDNPRTDLSKILYRPDRHNMVQIAFALRVKSRSKYWHKTRSDSIARNTNSGLPVELLAIVKELLDNNKGGKQDLHLNAPRTKA